MSRTRAKGLLEDSHWTITDYNPNGTVASGPTAYSSIRKSNGEFQTTTDVVIPNFVSRRASGEVFMNPFSVSKTRRSTATSTLTYGPLALWGSRVANGTLACEWSIPPNRPSWFNVRVSDARTRTLLRAHSKVASEEFLALVTVAEATKTARMLAKPFAGARDLVNRIFARKSALVRKGLTLGAAATSAWLEYRFGWKPILYDIQGIKEAYVNNQVWHEKPVRLVARASDADIVWDLPGSVTTALKTHGIYGVLSANYSHRAKVSSGVLYELRDDSLEQATARRMGLRLSDVPQSVWELVPFSFVVDRFVDIGVWLKAITPKPGVTVLGSWTSQLDYQLNFHTIVDSYIDVVLSGVTTRVHASGGTYSEEIQEISRTPNPPLPPLPTVNYRDLNLEQQIDHVALTIAILTGLKVPKS